VHSLNSTSTLISSLKPRLPRQLTNHLVDDAILIPGTAGTLLELQQVNFHYAT
jgi:hypothetical protein